MPEVQRANITIMHYIMLTSPLFTTNLCKISVPDVEHRASRRMEGRGRIAARSRPYRIAACSIVILDTMLIGANDLKLSTACKIGGNVSSDIARLESGVETSGLRRGRNYLSAGQENGEKRRDLNKPIA